MSNVVSAERRIKFLSRDLPFPVDPTFREYRIVQDITGVTAQEIMTGTAGIWMLPVLAIVALVRADPRMPRTALEKVLDLDPSDITLEGDFGDVEDEENPPEPAVPETASLPLTGTLSMPEIPVESGTPDLPTTSPVQQESPTT